MPRVTPPQIITAMVAAAVLAATLATGGPKAVGVLTPQTVVADLGLSGAYSTMLRAALLAQRADPASLPAALVAADQLVREGRAMGSSRLVGAALPILLPFVQGGNPEAQFLAATARQYQHDFPGALLLLDAVLAQDPLNVNARLSRATIHTVRGDLARAMEDCVLISAQRPDVGFLCQATALTLTRDAPAIADRLSAILAQPGALDDSLVPWAVSLLAEIALLHGDVAAAERHLRVVLAADPAAQREQLMLADLLLSEGRAAEVAPLLQTAPDTDGVLIRRVLAARAMGDDLPETVSILAKRAQRSLDIELDAHAREEAMFYLTIARDPALALDRAIANWALQHEYDDAHLLLLAAGAADKPEAARPVTDWMDQTGIAAPALAALPVALVLRDAVKP